MVAFRKQVKNLLEKLTGCEIERFGVKTFAVVDRGRSAEAWFSYHAQIRWIIEEFGIDLVIDVGANEGQFGRNLRPFYRGEIFSFEPVSSAFEKLAVAASSDPHWHAHRFALGSQESTHTIHVSDKTVFSSLLKANAYCIQRFGVGALGIKEEVVSVRRLETVLDEIAPDIANRRLLLKMDTQGYDNEVFNGLGSKLQHVIALQSEVSFISTYQGILHWTDSIAMYEREGFGVVGMFPVTRDSGRIIECDCLFIRVGG